MKKTVFFLFVSFLTVIFSCGNINSENKKETSSNQGAPDINHPKQQKNEIPKERITVIGVGDIMLGSNYPEKYLLPRNDTNILKSTESILREADITVGNLEGTLFDSGGSPKQCNNPSVCYVFRSPSKYGTYFKEAGFDYLSIANNHSNDFGDEGIEQTAKNLDQLGIKYSGIKGKFEYSTLERDGVKYGFVSFAPNMKTVSINDYDYASKLIKSVKEKSDILIVMFHGGAEGAKYEHVTRKNEIFYGENRGNVFKFARMAVDSGADIVFGQGPHVTRAIELYKEKFISYSGGNFATFGKFNLNGPSGIAPIFKITLNGRGDFVEGEIIPTRQFKGSFGPSVDSDNLVIKRIIYLNKTDFPEGNGLNVSDDGKITK